MDRLQRIAAYALCTDDASRLLMCRLSDVTERAGWWTLPGGGIHFGEDPEVAAIRELEEETGYTGRIVELLAVDSAHRTARGRLDGVDYDYHGVRIIYRAEITGGELRHEVQESTDYAAWWTRDELRSLPLVALGRLGVELAFASAPTEGRPDGS